MLVLDPSHGPRPERLRRLAPGPLEHVGQDEHGHVAAHPVAAVRHPGQLAAASPPAAPDWRSRAAACPASRRNTGPARRRGPTRPPCAGSSGAGGPGRTRVPEHVVVGMLGHPGVVGSSVVGHEVEDQPEPSLMQAGPEAGEGVVAAERRGDTRTRSRRSTSRRYRPRCRSGSARRNSSRQPRVAPGYGPAGVAGPPNAKQVDELEAVRGDTVEIGIGDVVQAWRRDRGSATDSVSRARALIW